MPRCIKCVAVNQEGQCKQENKCICFSIQYIIFIIHYISSVRLGIFFHLGEHSSCWHLYQVLKKALFCVILSRLFVYELPELLIPVKKVSENVLLKDYLIQILSIPCQTRMIISLNTYQHSANPLP